MGEPPEEGDSADSRGGRVSRSTGPVNSGEVPGAGSSCLALQT
jgi:hypothetical protein